jgi:LuxR family maltose regulon positive regulatory protein
VAYARDDLDAALRHLDEGIPLCRQFVHAPPLAAGLVTLAWIRNATGDPDGARDAISEAQRSARGPAGVYNPVPAQATRLRLAQGDASAAARWLQLNGLTVEGKIAYPDEPGHLVLARVLIAQGHPREALTLLDRLHAEALGQQRTGSVIETSALRALARAADGDQETALNALIEALELAGPSGHVRVFTDEGAPMATLLGRLLAVQRTGRIVDTVPSSYLARVLRSFTFAQPDNGSAVRRGLRTANPLTVRESEILDLMASGRSNQAIAAELVVSIDTVKKHVSHILDKLGAANRTEAVARGRELGLNS